MKRSLLLLFLLPAFAAMAQKDAGSVKGFLLDGTATNRQALDDATISVMDAKDSSLVSFTLTSNSGYFEVKNLPPGNYYLIVSYQGFANMKKSFSITAGNPVKDLADIKMDKSYKTLDEVVVTDAAPIKIKNDTVEYNAGAFKTKPNATVEDLLKKLPGVQVDKDGTVKTMGETVQKVYVDGKEFFGNDPKLATKNLSADMVESVQVYDDMSEQAKFSKIDDGSKQKAMNIKLKKDKKHGTFGKAVAGYGTDDRYDASLSLNQFNGNKRFSLIGAANNVNKQGFSFSDIIGMMGGFGGMMRGGGGSSDGFGGGGGGMSGMGNMVMGTRTGGGSGSNPFGAGSIASGISTNLSGGTNYTNSWSKVDLTGSAFYSHTNNDVQKNIHNESWSSRTRGGKITDSTTFTDTRSSGITNNNNGRFNLRLEWRIDSMNSLLYIPSGTIQHSTSSSSDTSTATGMIEGGTPTLSLTSHTNDNTKRDGYTINQNMLWRHKFRRAGRTLTVGWNNSLNNSDGSESVYSPNTSYKLQGTPVFFNQNQDIAQKTRGNNNVVSASYTEPLGLNKIMEFNYAYTDNHSTSDKNNILSNAFTFGHDSTRSDYLVNNYTSNRFGANFRLQQRKYNFQVGLGIQLGDLSTTTNTTTTRLVRKDTAVSLHQSYTNIFPTANFNYNFSRNKALRFTYRGRTNQPSISQLQDIPVSTSNPFQSTTGNPALGQEFVNNFNLSYNTFNIISFKYYAVNLNVSQTNNKIVNSIESVPAGPFGLRQVTKPVNVNGAYMASAFLAIGTPIKKIKGLNINANSIGLYNRDVSMINDVKSYNNTVSLTQTGGFNYNFKDKLDLGINGSINYNKIKYDSTPSANTDYVSQTYSFDASYTFPKNLILSSDFDYFVNSGRAAGFNTNIPMWNASIAKQFLKGKQAEIKFSVNDILNQNQSITRNTASNFVEDVQTNVLQRFFMVSLTYNLNRMAGKTMNMPKMMERNIRNMRMTN